MCAHDEIINCILYFFGESFFFNYTNDFLEEKIFSINIITIINIMKLLLYFPYHWYEIITHSKLLSENLDDIEKFCCICFHHIYRHIAYLSIKI